LSNDQPQTQPSEAPAPAGETHGFFGGSYVQEFGEEMKGFRLTNGWVEYDARTFGLTERGAAYYWAERLRNRHAEQWLAGFGLEYFALSFKGLHLYPRGAAALEYETRGRHHGLGGLLSIGGGAELRLGKHVALELWYERRASYPAEGSNRAGFDIRIMGDKIPSLAYLD
jgi:hypothetical protein